ncbi:MAG: hypothetical protein GXP37_12225 [Chloroflexi bacterium]|nr:hypothetical protein [Chloroflexota bacterium]
MGKGEAGLSRRCFVAPRFTAGRSALTPQVHPLQLNRAHRIRDAMKNRERRQGCIVLRRITAAANTRKKEAFGASVMRRSATSNLTPKFLGHTPRQIY